jgi:hypothetical protein
VPLNRIFHKSSFPVLLGLAAIAVFEAQASRRAAELAATQYREGVAIYKALGGVGQPLNDAPSAKVARVP